MACGAPGRRQVAPTSVPGGTFYGARISLTTATDIGATLALGPSATPGPAAGTRTAAEPDTPDEREEPARSEPVTFSVGPDAEVSLCTAVFRRVDLLLW